MTAEQIKEMQRRDPIAKEQWYAYCETYGDNVRDPAKHDSTFIGSFITQYNAGARLEYKEGAQLIQMIKIGQKKSQHWKAVWQMYCDQSLVDGKPVYDPAKHDSNFLEGFFDYIGKQAIANGGAAGMGGMPGMGGMLGMGMNTSAAGMGMGMGGMDMGMPTKRMRTSSGGMGMSTGDPLKDNLVQKIKAFQRQGDLQKSSWHGFCDASLNGVYDPARHDVATLQMFVTTHGLADGLGGGTSMGMGV